MVCLLQRRIKDWEVMVFCFAHLLICTTRCSLRGVVCSCHKNEVGVFTSDLVNSIVKKKICIIWGPSVDSGSTGANIYSTFSFIVTVFMPI